ncbi:MAG TPA: BTAD domain-containing putative transcriptional regulator [Streptosporangiaceae bacterium]|nr:BTAD domain-containing putative transcriptional regulator [Streptosporangiaceae bacterium]
MQVRLLGPVDVVVDGQPRLVGGRRRTGVLAVLALAAGEVVSAEWLSEAVWGGGSPPRDNTLHSHISALRRVLGKDAIVAHPPGYLLNLGTDGTDVQAAERLLRQGTAAAEPAQAVADLRAALGLWRGEPLTGVAGLPGLSGQPGRLEGLRTQIRRALVEARLAAGEHHQLTGELEQMVTAYPLDEQLHAQLMLALYRAGRQADALAAYDRIRQTLAADLGIDPGHALRDLHAAILRQDQSLTAPAPTAATSAAAASPVPAQLPLAVPGFTGRAAELARLDALLPPGDRAGTTSPAAPVAVTVISGTPGVGKTALAVHWAHRIAHRFPGGQLHADLRGYGPTGTAVSPSEALHGFLLALGVPPERIPADQDARTALYRTRLAGRRVLIVLDNARDPAQVRPLLPGTPGGLAIITSRRQLTPLVVTEDASPLTLDLMSAAEARDLLAARLGRQRARAEPGAVDEIIASCARLPLALAIAAARAAGRPGFTLAELAAELRDTQSGLDALGADDPATDPRAVFSWSYHALTQPAARLFRLLSLAPGPDITAPAAASLAALPLAQARRLLADLATAHLLTEHAPRRYACHDLLRAYARELAGRHDSDDILDAALDRVLGHYLHTSHIAAGLLESAAGAVAMEPLPPEVIPATPATAEDARDWFTAELAALLAAVRLAAGSGRVTYAWQLARNLTAFLVRRGRWDDNAQAQGTALEAARRAGDLAGTAYALYSLAVGYAWSGRTGEAGPLFGQALRQFESIGDDLGQARSHSSLGWLAGNAGSLDEALRHAGQAIGLYRAAGYRPGEARCLNDLGWYHALRGDYEQALTCCEQSLKALRETGERGGEATTSDSLGYIHHKLGNHRSSIAYYQRAIDILRDLGDRLDEADTLSRLGDVLHGSGDTAAARQAWLNALHIYDEIGHPDADEIRAKLQPPGARPESSSA